MLRTLLRMELTFYAHRQEQAPLLEEREAFLEHLLQQGTSLAAAHSVAWQLLNVIRLLRLTRLRNVRIEEIENAAQRWTRRQRSNPNVRSCKHSASFFTYVAKKWLRFAGVLKEAAAPRQRFADEVDEFARWMTEERGSAALTARSHQLKTTQFLKWVSERHRSLAAVRLRDVDDFLIFKGRNGWSRKSARGYADALRAFFRYAEQQRWCEPDIHRSSFKNASKDSFAAHSLMSSPQNYQLGGASESGRPMHRAFLNSQDLPSTISTS